MLNLWNELGPWAWIVLALALVGLEIVLPGAYLLWFGVAAAATGALLFVADIPLAGQIAVFAVLGAFAAYEGRRRFSAAEEPETVNTGAARLVGTTHTLIDPIVDGRSRLKVGDGWWSVDGPDMPAGSRVRVTAVDGNRLAVEPD